MGRPRQATKVFNRPFIILSVLLITVLVLFNLLLLNQNRRLQAKAGIPLNNVDARPGSIPLWLAIGCPPSLKSLLQERTLNQNPALSLLVFLSTGDCSSCLEEAEIWEQLYKQFSPNGFSVLGIVRQGDSLWAAQFSKNYELTFPVASLDSATLENLGVPPITPFKIIVDSLHRVVWLSGPNSGPEEQKSFGAVAEKLCRAYLLPG